jgi:DNA topoisomerase-1
VGLKQLIGSGWEAIDARAVCSVPLGKTEDGRGVFARVGRYGPYVQIEDSEQRATIPTDLPPDELTVEKAVALLEQAALGDRVLGHDPASGKPVYIKTGRFGPYVQLGDPELTEKGKIKKGAKPKMASLWPGMTMETISSDEALMLLSFPREVGAHPETGELITAQDGKFGPYLRMGTDSRSLENHQKLQSVTLAEAVEIFKQPKRGRRQAGAGIIADLGLRPGAEAKIQVKSGRFGPYVTDGVVNATIPKGYDPAHITMEKALELLAAREQKMRDQGKDPRAPKARKGKSTRSRKASDTSDSTPPSASDTSDKPRKTAKKPSAARRKSARRVPVGAAKG